MWQKRAEEGRSLLVEGVYNIIRHLALVAYLRLVLNGSQFSRRSFMALCKWSILASHRRYHQLQHWNSRHFEGKVHPAQKVGRCAALRRHVSLMFCGGYLFFWFCFRSGWHTKSICKINQKNGTLPTLQYPGISPVGYPKLAYTSERVRRTNCQHRFACQLVQAILHSNHTYGWKIKHFLPEVVPGVRESSIRNGLVWRLRDVIEQAMVVESNWMRTDNQEAGVNCRCSNHGHNQPVHTNPIRLMSRESDTCSLVRHPHPRQIAFTCSLFAPKLQAATSKAWAVIPVQRLKNDSSDEFSTCVLKVCSTAMKGCCCCPEMYEIRWVPSGQGNLWYKDPW